MKKLHPQSKFSKIPAEWLLDTGADKFRPESVGFFCNDANARLISIFSIKPPERAPKFELKYNNHPELGFGWLCKSRSIRILNGFLTKAAFPPISVCQSHTVADYDYWLLDGLHRYYCSIAVGFKYIPALKIPYVVELYETRD